MLQIYTFTMRSIFRPFPIILLPTLMQKPSFAFILSILKVSLIFCPIHIIISSITIFQSILILTNKLISILIVFYRFSMPFIIDPDALWLKSIFCEVSTFSVLLSIYNLTFIFISVLVIKNSFSMGNTIFGLTFVFVDIFKHFFYKLLIDWVLLIEIFPLLTNLILIQHRLIS